MYTFFINLIAKLYNGTKKRGTILIPLFAVILDE